MMSAESVYIVMIDLVCPVLANRKLAFMQIKNGEMFFFDELIMHHYLFVQNM